jgi:2-desacetyl-2-hydroxyethyl bacteriochlorophyllide A dehydrogenase
MVRAVEIVAPGQIRLTERAHEPSSAGVRLRVDAVGICGSDVALVAGRHPYAVYPITPGHEVAATVLDAPESAHLEPGQQVAIFPLLTCGRCRACREGRPNHCPEVRVIGVHVDGGMVEEISLPVGMVRPVPDTISVEGAAMVEPTAVAVHACHRAGVREGTSVAIIGAGVIGMLALQVARAWDAGPTLAVDRILNRLHLAEDLGADRVFDNRRSSALETGRELCPAGFDVVLELVGRRATLDDALALARPGGTIVLVALPQGTAQRAEFFDFELLYRKELSLRATRLYDADFDTAIPLLASGRVDPQPLITHRFPLDAVDRAFVLAAEHPEEAVKVMVNPHGGGRH